MFVVQLSERSVVRWALALRDSIKSGCTVLVTELITDSETTLRPAVSKVETVSTMMLVPAVVPGATLPGVEVLVVVPAVVEAARRASRLRCTMSSSCF